MALISSGAADQEQGLDPITEEDLSEALAVTKPSAALNLDKYAKFSDMFGEAGA